MQFATTSSSGRLVRDTAGCAGIGDYAHDPTLLRVPTLIVSVPGTRKAKIMRRTVEEAISTDCPATSLRTHPDVTVYFDPDSAAEFGWIGIFELKKNSRDSNRGDLVPEVQVEGAENALLSNLDGKSPPPCRKQRQRPHLKDIVEFG